MPGRPTGKLIEFAKALYKPGRSAAELAVWGLKPEDFADDAFEVWDESALSANAFTWVMTQWRPGFNGPTGLDYTAAMAALRARGLTVAQIKEIFPDLQHMERAALDQMAENAEAEREKQKRTG